MIKHAYYFPSYYCQAHCVHCFASAGSWHGEQLPLEKERQILYTLYKNGVSKLIYLGGEPFINPDTPDLIAGSISDGDHLPGALDLFDHVSIETNGLVIDYNFIRAVDYFHPNPKNLTIAVSVEDLRPEYNDMIRGRGSLAKALVALETYKQLGFDTAIRSTIFNNNDIEGIVKYAIENGHHFTAVRFIPVGRGNVIKDLAPTPERMAEIYSYFKDLNPEFTSTDISDCQFYLFNPHRYSRYHKLYRKGSACQAARGERIVIDPKGDVYPCYMLQTPKMRVGNILKDDYNIIVKRLEEIGKKFLTKELRKECSSCPLVKHCGGGCMALSLNSPKRGDPKCPLRALDIHKIKVMAK